MVQRVLTFVVAAGMIVSGSAFTFAQQPHTAGPSIDELVQQARGNMLKISPQQVAEVKARTQAALDDVFGYLERSGKANSAAWQKYLEWPKVVELLNADVPNPNELERILTKWEDNKPSLENPRFIRARKALRDYVYLASDVANPNYADEYVRRIDELPKLIQTYEETGSGDDGAAVGRTLGWLERSGQAETLVKAVRARYQRPNFLGYGSARFAAIGFDQPVDRVTPVSDVILGTYVRGTAHMTGGTTLKLVPDANAARFNLLLAGTAVSNNVGTNRGVVIYSTGVTSLQASKQLWMEESGLFSSPATATGRTSTTINGISAGGHLKQKIATNRVYESKPEAEAIASQRAAARLQASFDAEVAPMLADANSRFIERFKTPMIRRNAYPDDIQFSTTPYYVVVKALSADKSQLGAPTPPAKLPLPYDLCAQVHESAVINYGEALLAGRLLTDERLVELIRDELKSEVPDELKITEDKDPWTITFARETPVRARFEGNRVFLAIRGDRFTRAEQVISEPIEISATYDVKITDQGTARLVRDGEVQVNFLKRDRLSAAQVGFRTFLRRKFEAMFKEEFVGEGLKLKGRWEKAGTLRLELLDANNHWINLGWNLPTGGQKPRLASEPAKAGPAEATAPVSAPSQDALALRLSQWLGLTPPAE
jgi:hypothetical protein